MSSADHALKLLASAVGMTPREVMSNPHAARDRWKALQADRRRQATAAALDPKRIYARLNGKASDRDIEDATRRLDENTRQNGRKRARK